MLARCAVRGLGEGVDQRRCVVVRNAERLGNSARSGSARQTRVVRRSSDESIVRRMYGVTHGFGHSMALDTQRDSGVCSPRSLTDLLATSTAQPLSDGFRDRRLLRDI